MNLPDLSNRTALVTGGSRGIGRAACLRLAEAGARIIAHYGASRDAALSLVEEITAKGGKADAIGADLSLPDSPHKIAEAVRGLGVHSLDILVSSAGISEPAPLEQQSVEGFDRHFALNVRTPYFLVQQLLPLLKEGSSIILFSSSTARTAFEGLSVYSATKGAIEVLTRNLAKELGPRGVRVNAIAPGAINTEMAKPFLGTEEGRAAIQSTQALQRIGDPHDVADVVLFLASDESRWIDGRSIEVSGGAML
jgi:3-oxoacyl-[acyl-carrier protein] reductase